MGGVRAVPCTTWAGLWTGLRNFLRPLRGVSKWNRAHYVAVFPGAYTLKQVTQEFLRILLGMPPSTVLAPGAKLSFSETVAALPGPI